MNPNALRHCIILLVLSLFLNSGCRTAPPATHAITSASRPPNIVLIFCDDMGYGDIGPFGSKTPTPHLDSLTREGMRFTDFYVGQAVCSASRAALMTGCYPNRVGVQGAYPPRSKMGLNPNEITIAEVLKGRGYATAIYGKWHLGDAPEFLPTRQGFDDYFGLPYSNDMWPHHPTSKTNYPPLPLYENERVVQIMPDQTQLTTWYTERAVKFIECNKSQPFFLYLAHNMPHVPIFVSDKFKGKSGRGLYGDVIMEIDWSVGQVLDSLKRNGLDEKTLVVFTSDNGPWLLYGDHAGDAGPLREGKATSWDGGVRVPAVMRWPGKIPANKTCNELVSTIDLLPTFATLAGTNAPTDRIIDGRNISPLMFGASGAKTPHDAFFVYWGQELQAVRSGNWKLHLPHVYPRPTPPGSGGQPGKYAQQRTELALFDLGKDIGETRNVADEHPDVVARLQRLFKQCRSDLGDSRTKQKGSGVREAGRVQL
ncbi:MAG TPA: sulfatase [Candidatus Acidoferrum sp.]|nr:sulfatase [Candidatus Acidoferrum sp.]